MVAWWWFIMVESEESPETHPRFGKSPFKPPSFSPKHPILWPFEVLTNGVNVWMRTVGNVDPVTIGSFCGQPRSLNHSPWKGRLVFQPSFCRGELLNFGRVIGWLPFTGWWKGWWFPIIAGISQNDDTFHIEDPGQKVNHQLSTNQPLFQPTVGQQKQTTWTEICVYCRYIYINTLSGK